MNLSKKSKILLFILLGIFIIGFGMYKYAYQPHKTIEDFKVDFNGASKDFFVKIQENDSIWQNKGVVLSGVITAKDAKGITLDENTYCQFRDAATLHSLENNQTIKIKGRIIGYDDLLEELKLDQCIIQE
ncbi:MAG: hypothetical protein GKR88_00225 [Flavobacteriaceae bacterium]|nr:MAG: hypothetical protein GKR88_00225 [Flavobacteriaceae bacterium]